MSWVENQVNAITIWLHKNSATTDERNVKSEPIFCAHNNLPTSEVRALFRKFDLIFIDFFPMAWN